MGRRTIYSAVLLLVACATFKAPAGADDVDDICGDIDGDSVKLDFPVMFAANVEIVLPSMGDIVNSQLYFNHDFLKIEQPHLERQVFYDFAHKQILWYDFTKGGRGECTVRTDMQGTEGFHLVPNPAPNDDDYRPKIPDILRLTGYSGFGNAKIQLQFTKNITKFRSLAVKQYVSCQKLTDHDGSVLVAKVTHLLSNTKFTRTEEGTVPVQIKFQGKYISGEKKDKQENAIYNFFHYTTRLPRDIMQPPVGIVCKNRKGPSNFPDVPSYVQFGQEIHYPEGNQRPMLSIKTTYDQELKYVMEQQFNPHNGIFYDYRLDDFDAGLSYSIDYSQSACSVQNITEVTKVNDFAKDKDGKIMIMTPEKFWDKSGVEYHYNGKKHFRGMETEAWIGTDPNNGHTYEWYFTANLKHTINDYAKQTQKNKDIRIPFKRLLWLDDSDDVYSTYYYQVDLTTPDHNFNLIPCFLNNQLNMAIYVKGLREDIVNTNRNVVIRKALKRLATALGIRFTRINAFSITFIGGKGYFTFTLLGNHEFSSDVTVSAKAPKQPTLAEVKASLLKQLNDGSLRFEVGNDEVYEESEARYDEHLYDQLFNPVSPGGYSAGSMAGLAIAMAIIGIAGGGAGAFWFFIKRS